LNLTFSLPLYVSSFDGKDSVDIEFSNPSMFKAKSNNQTIPENYTISSIELPAQVKSSEDLVKIETIESSAQTSMVFTLIIPFAFMIFMSVAMERVWSLYNTM
jgi:hypothetical protein